MQLTMDEAVKNRAGSKKLVGLGKYWDVGDQLKVFYPLTWDENGNPSIIVASVWGHPVPNMEEFGLKTTFIPTTCEINNGEVVGEEDITYKFSKIAAAYIEGEKQAKIMKAQKKFAAQQDMLQTKLEEIRKQYDTSNNMNARRAVIGALKNIISTEVLAVKCKDGKPLRESQPQVATQALSDERIAALRAILKDSRFCPEVGTPYLEVEYNFTASDGKKSTAGRQQPRGLSETERLSYTDPQFWNSISGYISNLATDSEVMQRRNMSFRPQSLNKVLNAIKMYAISNSENLETLPEDSEEKFLKSASRIRDLGIQLPVELQAKVDEELRNNQEVNSVETPADTTPDLEAPPTMEGLINNDYEMTDDMINSFNESLTAPID